MCDQRLGQTGKWIFSNDIVAGARYDWRQTKDADDQPPAHFHPADIGQLPPAMWGSQSVRVSQHDINNNLTQRITRWESQVLAVFQQ